MQCHTERDDYVHQPFVSRVVRALVYFVKYRIPQLELLCVCWGQYTIAGLRHLCVTLMFWRFVYEIYNLIKITSGNRSGAAVQQINVRPGFEKGLLPPVIITRNSVAEKSNGTSQPRH